MKIFLVLSINIFLIFSAVAQEKIVGVMMRNGKVIIIKKAMMSKISEEINFCNGSKLTCKGIIIQKNGTRINLCEGDYLNSEGEKTENIYLIPADDSVKDTLK